MTKTKKICYLAMLTALYVVLSAFLKFYVGVGHIQVDLGYIAFCVALCVFGVHGAIVGVVGCAIESALFTAYGFSISWAVANAVIGIGCGVAFRKTKNVYLRITAIILYCAIGLVLCKTAIECALYNIPVLVKLPKSLAAFAIDAAVMIASLAIYKKLEERIKK